MGSFLQGVFTGDLALGITSLNTGSAPQTNGGSAIKMNDVAPGTLSATVYMQAKVNTMTLEPQWQVSSDNSTWYDVKLPNGAASVVAVTGTGSNVSKTLVVEAPGAVHGWQYARCSVVSRVASASDSNDQYNVSYNYLKRGYGNVAY